MSIAIDVNKLKSNLNINRTLIFTEKSFFILYWNTGFYSITLLSSRRDRWILSIDCGII